MKIEHFILTFKEIQRANDIPANLKKKQLDDHLKEIRSVFIEDPKYKQTKENELAHLLCDEIQAELKTSQKIGTIIVE